MSPEGGMGRERYVPDPEKTGEVEIVPDQIDQVAPEELYNKDGELDIPGVGSDPQLDFLRKEFEAITDSFSAERKGDFFTRDDANELLFLLEHANARIEALQNKHPELLKGFEKLGQTKEATAESMKAYFKRLGEYRAFVDEVLDQVLEWHLDQTDDEMRDRLKVLAEKGSKWKDVSDYLARHIDSSYTTDDIPELQETVGLLEDAAESAIMNADDPKEVEDLGAVADYLDRQLIDLYKKESSDNPEDYLFNGDNQKMDELRDLQTRLIGVEVEAMEFARAGAKTEVIEHYPEEAKSVVALRELFASAVKSGEAGKLAQFENEVAELVQALDRIYEVEMKDARAKQSYEKAIAAEQLLTDAIGLEYAIKRYNKSA